MNKFLKGTILGALIFVIGACGETVSHSDSVRLRQTTLPAVGNDGELRYDADTEQLRRWTDTGGVWESIDNLGNHTATEDLNMGSSDINNLGNLSIDSIGSQGVITGQFPTGTLDLTTDIELTSALAGTVRQYLFDFNAETPGDSATFTEANIAQGDFLDVFFDNSRGSTSNVFTVSALADGIDGTSGLMLQENLRTGTFIDSEARIRLDRTGGNDLSFNGKQFMVFKYSEKVEIKPTLTAHALGTIKEGDTSFEYRVGVESFADGSRLQASDAFFSGRWYIHVFVNGAVVDRVDSGVTRTDPVVVEFEKIANGDELVRIRDVSTNAILAESRLLSKDATLDRFSNPTLTFTSTHTYAGTETDTQPPPIFFDDLAFTTDRFQETYQLFVEPAAANPTDTILVDFPIFPTSPFGFADEITVVITPNDGTNNGATPVDLTTAEFVELTNTGAVAGKTITLTDTNSHRTLVTATGGDATVLVDSGEGDLVIAAMAGGKNATDGKLVISSAAGTTLIGPLAIQDGSEGTSGHVLTSSDTGGTAGWAVHVGDNLGDHTATTTLLMGTNDITGVGANITGAGQITIKGTSGGGLILDPNGVFVKIPSFFQYDDATAAAGFFLKSLDADGNAVWAALPDITEIELSATADTSTASNTYVVMDTMTSTPAAGTYSVSFSSSGTASAANADLMYAIFDDGVIVQHTERDLNFTGAAGFDTALHSQAIVVTAGGEAIDVRFKTDSGNFDVNERSLILIKVD